MGGRISVAISEALYQYRVFVTDDFQLAMLAYNLNCWLMLFNREAQADTTAEASCASTRCCNLGSPTPGRERGVALELKNQLRKICTAGSVRGEEPNESWWT
jgi:hypothetical protein